MKKIKCGIDCRAIGSYDTEIIVPDDATEDDINKAIEDKLDYYIWHDPFPEHIDCSTCIHQVVCGVKPADKQGCTNWRN